MENTTEEKALTTKKGTELYADAVAEYVLPDYKGDVKRVLHTEARALPTGKFVGEDGVELTGAVAFDVLYLDAENNFTSVSFTSDYSASTEKTDDVADVFADVRCEGLSVRLTGPRKISARCKAVLSLFEDREMSGNAVGTTFNEESSPELCCTAVGAQRFLRGSLADRELADRELAEEFLYLAGASIDEVSVSGERADLRINSAVSADGSVALVGEIAVSCIAKIGEAAPRFESVRIPFDERVAVEGARDGMPSAGRGTVASVRCIPTPTDDGVRVSANVIIDLDALTFTNEKLEVVTDAYSKVLECENSYDTVGYCEFLDSKRTTARVSREVAKKDTDAPLASEVVYLCVTPLTESVGIDGSSVKIGGEIVFSGVACEISEDGVPNYTSLKIGVPFSENVNFSGQIPQNATVECFIDAFDPHISLDSVNFYVECNISANVILSEARDLRRLVRSDVTEGTAREASASVISVYYPEEGDTLFGVSKRFKLSPSKIAADNALTEEAVSRQDSSSSLAAVKKLLIKRM